MCGDLTCCPCFTHAGVMRDGHLSAHLISSWSLLKLWGVSTDYSIMHGDVTWLPPYTHRMRISQRPLHIVFEFHIIHAEPKFKHRWYLEADAEAFLFCISFGDISWIIWVRLILGKGKLIFAFTLRREYIMYKHSSGHSYHKITFHKLW